MGSHVVPLLLVFQTPLEASAMYISAVLSGLTAISAMRPEVVAGPKPLKVKALILCSAHLGLSFFDFFCA